MSPPYRLVSTAVFKQESPFLLEWVAYHTLVGVEKFLLFDDNSDKKESRRSREVLGYFIDRGTVEIRKFRASPTLMRQSEVYDAACAEFRDRTTWLSLTDIDEFIVPEMGNSIPDALRQFEDDENLAALGLHWKVFGTSGQQKRRPLQLRDFTWRGTANKSVSRVIKYVVRPERIESNHGHVTLPFGGFVCKNTLGDEVSWSKSARVTYDKLAVHHYAVRSEEDWKVKVARGWKHAVDKPAWPAGHWKKRKMELNLNDERDTSAVRFVSKVIKLMVEASRRR